MRYTPWNPGDPCRVCQKIILTAAEKFKPDRAICKPCGNKWQASNRVANKPPLVPKPYIPRQTTPPKDPMTCTKCKEKPQKLNSIKGMCEDCTREDTLAKARIRAADQHRRRMAAVVVTLCACGCGEKCRPGATYATKQHRETHERETREKHRQPRATVKPPDDYKLKHMSKAEKKTVEVLPVLDTEAEKRRHAELLERARVNRVELSFSRWS